MAALPKSPVATVDKTTLTLLRQVIASIFD